MVILQRVELITVTSNILKSLPSVMESMDSLLQDLDQFSGLLSQYLLSNSVVNEAFNVVPIYRYEEVEKMVRIHEAGDENHFGKVLLGQSSSNPYIPFFQKSATRSYLESYQFDTFLYHFFEHYHWIDVWNEL